MTPAHRFVVLLFWSLDPLKREGDHSFSVFLSKITSTGHDFDQIHCMQQCPLCEDSLFHRVTGKPKVIETASGCAEEMERR
jgi:hypothetical protein